MFPGGQAAFFDVLLTTKQIQLKTLAKRYEQVTAVYDGFAPEYQLLIKNADFDYYKLVRHFVSTFDFSGTVLDVACGTGYLGKLLHDQGTRAEITGIELSKGMLDFPAIKDYYKQPLLIGPMQELGAGEHDHIVCFGALHFLDRVQFNAVLARMFMLARRSVTFEIVDLDDGYIAKVKEKHGEQCYNSNNIEAINAFGVPKGWKKVYDERHPMYLSPTSKTEISGSWMRFEKA